MRPKWTHCMKFLLSLLKAVGTVSKIHLLIWDHEVEDSYVDRETQMEGEQEEHEESPMCVIDSSLNILYNRKKIFSHVLQIVILSCSERGIVKLIPK